jgi:hypothetical protein
MDFLNRREGGVVFPLSVLQCTLTHCRNCKRLREFGEFFYLYFPKDSNKDTIW